jgi:hypothetical protein
MKVAVSERIHTEDLADKYRSFRNWRRASFQGISDKGSAPLEPNNIAALGLIYKLNQTLN